MSAAIQAQAAKPHLVVEKASIRFGGLLALSEFSLTVGRGDLFGLIGPNGAGKTTAFNVLTGVYRPTSGRVLVGGVEVMGKRPHKITALGVARTFQNIRLFRELSVLDNVRIACHHSAKAAWFQTVLRTSTFLGEEADITRRAMKTLEVMGLDGKRDELSRNLPYGEQRRLEIARVRGGPRKVARAPGAPAVAPMERRSPVQRGERLGPAWFCGATPAWTAAGSPGWPAESSRRPSRLRWTCRSSSCASARTSCRWASTGAAPSGWSGAAPAADR